MMNQKIYRALEQELEGCRIHEDVEDILLCLAEGLGEKGILNKETGFSENFGKTKITARGICQEENGEISVRILTVQIGKKEFDIDDYFL